MYTRHLQAGGEIYIIMAAIQPLIPPVHCTVHTRARERSEPTSQPARTVLIQEDFVDETGTGINPLLRAGHIYTYIYARGSN